MYDKWIQHMLEESEQKLAGNGRIIMRMSGTEPKVRVMVESEDSSLVDRNFVLVQKIHQFGG